MQEVVVWMKVSTRHFDNMLHSGFGPRVKFSNCCRFNLIPTASKASIAVSLPLSVCKSLFSLSLLVPGSEPAAVDERSEENRETAVDASPSTEVPSPATGTTGQTGQADPTESHDTLGAQQEATEAASTSDLPKEEEAQIPQSTREEAKGQFQAADENADGAVI